MDDLLQQFYYLVENRLPKSKILCYSMNGIYKIAIRCACERNTHAGNDTKTIRIQQTNKGCEDFMSDDLLGKEYIANWELNAKQHFDDGDYEWICDIIQEYFPDGSCERILEIGCGAGYSTLVFLLRDYRVVSVDMNAEAVKHTDELIKKHDYRN